MLDPQLVIELATSALCILILSQFIRGYTWNSKMNDALTYQHSLIAYGHGNAVVGLAMIANALKRLDRDFAIHHLLRLATLNNNPEAFFALRDHIDSRVLRRVLKTWHTRNLVQEFLGRGDLGPIITGGVIGQANGMKLVCFAEGTRTLQHLDASLSEAERSMLRTKYGVGQPLEAVEASTG